jgi:hypothetical protein
VQRDVLKAVLGSRELEKLCAVLLVVANAMSGIEGRGIPAGAPVNDTRTARAGDVGDARNRSAVDANWGVGREWENAATACIVDKKSDMWICSR